MSYLSEDVVSPKVSIKKNSKERLPAETWLVFRFLTRQWVVQNTLRYLKAIRVRLFGGLTDTFLLLPKICYTYPTMMKLRKEIKKYVDSKEIQKYVNHVTQPLSSANIRNSVSTKNQQFSLHREIQVKIAF